MAIFLLMDEIWSQVRINKFTSLWYPVTESSFF